MSEEIKTMNDMPVRPSGPDNIWAQFLPYDTGEISVDAYDHEFDGGTKYVRADLSTTAQIDNALTKRIVGWLDTLIEIETFNMADDIETIKGCLDCGGLSKNKSCATCNDDGCVSDYIADDVPGGLIECPDCSKTTTPSTTHDMDKLAKVRELASNVLDTVYEAPHVSGLKQILSLLDSMGVK